VGEETKKKQQQRRRESNDTVSTRPVSSAHSVHGWLSAKWTERFKVVVGQLRQGAESEPALSYQP